MTKSKLMPLLPYIGIPIIGVAFYFICAWRTDLFTVLLGEMLLLSGYVATVFDIKVKKIPNKLVLAMMAAWVLVMMPKLLLDTEVALVMLKDAGWGFLAGGGLFFLIYLISRKGLGGGDVKFMAVAGLYLGFGGVMTSMLYGSILVGLTGLILLLLKKVGPKDTLPLAPFLYAGILVTIFYG